MKYAGFKYLTGKAGHKGKEIQYLFLVTSDYLLPDSYGLSLQEKPELFSFRNWMSMIHENFENYICGEK